MIEADLWRAIIGVLRTGLDVQGLNAIAIKQSFQPRKQGANSQDTIYLFKVTTKRVGSQGRKYEYNENNDEFDGQENYWIEATYQLTPVINRDVSDSSSRTSYDIADLCAAILQSYDARKKLLESGIGILRIGDIRNPFSTNDREQFQQDSNFDFTLTYQQIYSTTVPVADPIEQDMQRV